MGAYEPSTALDGDGDEDGDGNIPYRFGENYPNEPEYAFVYYEVLRDAHNDGDPFGYVAGGYTQTHHEQQTVVHEIGHQFELGHVATATSIMGAPPGPTRPDTFSEDELATIRQTQSP